MTQIICLANSFKHKERCIAGINPQTGKWIRPVCDRYPEDGRVPSDIRLIQGKEPQLLDLLEIPLKNDGPDFGFKSENLTIAPGQWKIIKKVKPTEIIQYCDNYSNILHNRNKYVEVPLLRSLPFQQRRTLQLVYTSKLLLEQKDGTKWKGSLMTNTGQILLNDASITDPQFLNKLDNGYSPQNPCLVTVSLSMPYRPSNWEGGDPCPCWKLIAGVIEFSSADLILVEMKRIGWETERGRNYLKTTYNKQSRQQLTKSELTEFLDYLKSLPDRENYQKYHL